MPVRALAATVMSRKLNVYFCLMNYIAFPSLPIKVVLGAQPYCMAKNSGYII